MSDALNVEPLILHRRVKTTLGAPSSPAPLIVTFTAVIPEASAFATICVVNACAKPLGTLNGPGVARLSMT